jgi:hypothetical protein
MEIPVPEDAWFKPPQQASNTGDTDFGMYVLISHAVILFTKLDL